MTDPRGAAARSTSGSEQATTTSETALFGAPGAPTARDVLGAAGAAERGLDASAHAHVLDDPLPPELPDDAPLFRELRGHPAPSRADAGPAPTDLVDTAIVEPVRPGPTAGDAPGTSDRRDTGERTAEPTADAAQPRLGRPTRVAAALIALALVATGVLAAYLYQSARDWRAQAGGYLAAARDIGEDLAVSRSDLAGAQAELEAVRAQLAMAHQRITELADEKAQIGDQREVTQQLVAYQERISDAAGQVAHALDRCVQGQQELIDYLQRVATDPTAVLPPDQLTKFRADVDAFCASASMANAALQRELSR